MTILTMKDEKRLEIIQRVFRGELTMAEAGLVLGVSERQCYRIKARVNQQGVKGVIRKFSKPPANAVPAWRKVSLNQITQALCFKQQRTVGNDNTVSFEGTVFQIPKKSPYRSYANKRIDVHVLLDGAVEFFYQKEKIARFDSKTTHVFGLYRTNAKREGFRYGPISSLTTHTTESSP